MQYFTKFGAGLLKRPRDYGINTGGFAKGFHLFRFLVDSIVLHRGVVHTSFFIF